MARKLSPQEFCKARKAAIEAASVGKNSFWTVLGTGSLHQGAIGALRIRDQWGSEGLIVQDSFGASNGYTTINLGDYAETARAA